MIILVAAPLVLTIYLSLTNFTYGADPVFIGLENFRKVLSDEQFWGSMGFTLVYVVITTSLQLVLGLAVAMIIDKLKFGKGISISLVMIPFFIVPIVGSMIWGWMFRAHWGYFSYLLSKLNIFINWYDNARAAQAMILSHGVWMLAPWMILLFYAGLQTIPRESMEAALIDGANGWQRLFHVIIAHLRSLVLFAAMIGVMDGYRFFESSYQITQGGPGSATESLMYFNYYISFRELSLGKGSAISVLSVMGTFLIMAPFLYLTYRESTEALR